jgi:hypothetical protein
MRRRTRSLDATFFFLVAVVISNVSWGADAASTHKPAPEKSSAKPASKKFKLPGVVIDFHNRYVDLEGTVCLDQGFLELVACTKGSKEHESIVAIEANQMHVHTALLLLGAVNGNSAMRKPVDEEKTRWVNLPPRGDPIYVYLVFTNSDGTIVERPISTFITRAKKRPDEIEIDDDRGEKDEADKESKFPNTFLFAGSPLRGNGKGARQYLADLSGHVISIATFGDELLCLPGIQSHANGALMWKVDSKHLPDVGTRITLRLRPKKDQRTGVGK